MDGLRGPFLHLRQGCGYGPDIEGSRSICSIRSQLALLFLCRPGAAVQLPRAFSALLWPQHLMPSLGSRQLCWCHMTAVMGLVFPPWIVIRHLVQLLVRESVSHTRVVSNGGPQEASLQTNTFAESRGGYLMQTWECCIHNHCFTWLGCMVS